MSQRRHKARVMAMQAIYQWQLNGEEPAELCRQFAEREDGKTYTSSFFRELIEGVIIGCRTMDEQLGPLLGRSIESMDMVERAIVRLGAFELGHHLEVPYRVVINEWVEVTKEYGADQGYRFVNGVLDRLAKTSRALERNAQD
jgi:transcription antitermination protein NusB